LAGGTYGAFEENNRFRRIKLAKTYSAMIVPAGTGYVYYRGTMPLPFMLDDTQSDLGIPADLIDDILHEDFFIVSVPLKEEGRSFSTSEDDHAQITMTFRSGQLEEFSLREVTHNGTEPSFLKADAHTHLGLLGDGEP
jgi:hypothetical protein